MSIQTAGVIPVLTRGQRLTIAMEHAGMKPEDMALELRVSATTIRNYVSERTKIDWAHLRMWSDVTGVDLAWLDTGAVVPQGGGLESVERMGKRQDDTLGPDVRFLLRAVS